MKSIRTGRIKRKYDGRTYTYFDIQTRSEKSLSRDELYELGRTLPEKVKKVFRKIDLFKVPMTEQEQRDALLLCSLSISCWKGYPRISIKGVSIEDYYNDFYIQMVGCMRTWDPSKGPWPSYVKWVRLKAIDALFKRINSTERRMPAARSHGQTAETGPDFRSLQELGLQVSRGNRVSNANPKF